MGDVNGCWRRPAMPPVVRKCKGKKKQVVLPQPSLVVPPEYYEQPELDLDREVTRYKRRMQRRREMGEASDIVGKHDHFPKPAEVGGSVIARIGGMIEDLDRAMQVKEHDLAVEGDALRAENHYKLGILKGADSLLRRARAMLQDYGSDLEQDFDPTEDEEAAAGDELEQPGADVIPLNGDADDDDECPHEPDENGVCKLCGAIDAEFPDEDGDGSGNGA